MLVLAHRGHTSAHAVENTMDAFAAAVSLGVDGIETDVRLTADRQLVLVHDRNTPDGHPVCRLSLHELRTHLGVAVPTVQDAIDAWPDILWNLEVKVPEAAPQLADYLEPLTKRHRFLVTSFRHDIISFLHATLVCDTGVLVAHRPIDGRSLLSGWINKVPSAIVWEYEAFNPESLQNVHLQRLQHFVYGAETAEEHQLCRDSGVVGVITDYPAKAML